MSKIATLGEMYADMKSGVYDFTKNGECSNCGECCSNMLPISQEEIRRIQRYIEKHGILEQVKRSPMRIPAIDMSCPFRDNVARKCLVYEVRPAICRDFRCDKPKNRIEADKKMYHKRCTPVDMRAVFYGRESVLTQILRNNAEGE